MTARAGHGRPGGGRRPAGLVSRLTAAALDAVTVYTLVIVVHVGVLIALQVLSGGPLGALDLSSWAAVAGALGLAIGYLGWGWTTTGRTLGDQLIGLRVLGRSGRPLGPGRALLRAVMYVAFPAGLLWVPVSRRRASVQDLIVGSVVVYDWRYAIYDD